VAAGSPFWQTTQIGQLHFEPFWGLLVASLSGFEPERVLTMYPFLALLTVTGYAIAVYVGLATPDLRTAWSPWERATAAGFATQLCAQPLDFTGSYETAWAATFLLKPNHALGLVLFPLFLRAFAGITGARRRLATGLLLNLMAWAFVLHMAFVAVGLVVFAVGSWLERHPEARRDAVDSFGVIAINLLIASPYLSMLVIGYPFLTRSTQATIPAWSPHLLEVVGRAAPLVALAVWGLRVVRRRGDRLGRLLAAQVVAGWLVWAGYIVLSAAQLARERDEAFYWARFMTALGAGLGAWDLAGRAWRWIRRRDPAPFQRAAALALLTLPWSIAYWWDPSLMDVYFKRCLKPVPRSIDAMGLYLRRQTAPEAVVAGDRDLARWVAALGARRVLLTSSLNWPSDTAARVAAEAALVRGADPANLARAVGTYGVQYLLLGPKLSELYPGVSLSELRLRPELREVLHLADGEGPAITLFRVVDRGDSMRATPPP
jgi:hypothetical protein